MTKIYLLIFLALACASCSTNTPADTNHVDTVLTGAQKRYETANNLLADTLKVKQWLSNAIESYTNDEDVATSSKTLRNSLTDSYYNYKLDAISLEYDSDTLAAEKFKKWQGKYDTRYVGSGGFIISAQDNGKVKVTSCNYFKESGQNASIYRVVIEDLDYKAKFNRDIKVIVQNGRLLIDDIIEYD